MSVPIGTCYLITTIPSPGAPSVQCFDVLNPRFAAHTGILTVGKPESRFRNFDGDAPMWMTNAIDRIVSATNAEARPCG